MAQATYPLPANPPSVLAALKPPPRVAGMLQGLAEVIDESAQEPVTWIASYCWEDGEDEATTAEVSHVWTGRGWAWVQDMGQKLERRLNAALRAELCAEVTL